MSGLVSQVTLDQNEPINFDSSDVEGHDEISLAIGLPGWEYNDKEELVGFVTLDEREAELVSEAMRKASFHTTQHVVSSFLTDSDEDFDDDCPQIEAV
ncbi:MAG: hypothetical protein Q7S16_05615 [bacterium]|nr:hypothetical protein [bacterium]